MNGGSDHIKKVLVPANTNAFCCELVCPTAKLKLGRKLKHRCYVCVFVITLRKKNKFLVISGETISFVSKRITQCFAKERPTTQVLTQLHRAYVRAGVPDSTCLLLDGLP